MRLTLFNAARLITLTPILSALRIASSMSLFMPSAAKGKKYCNTIYVLDARNRMEMINSESNSEMYWEH